MLKGAFTVPTTKDNGSFPLLVSLNFFCLLDTSRTVRVQFVANNDGTMPWEFHPHEFTVAPLSTEMGRPIQTMGFKQHLALVHIVGIQGRSHTEIRHAGQRLGIQSMHHGHKNTAGRGFGMAKTQIQRGALQFTPEFAAMHHMARHRIGPT